MGSEYLEKSNDHEIWVEDDIIYDKSKVVELTEEHANRVFDVIEKQLAKMKGKRKLIMVIVPNVMSLAVEKGQAKLRFGRMGIDKLAMVTGNSTVAGMVINFALRMTRRKDMKIEIFKNEKEAKAWLLKP